MLQDLRFALRMLRRSPGFTAVAVLVLALGIGVNTAIFSLVNATLIEPLPFPHPEQLVQMYETEAAPGNYPLSGPDFPDWRAQARLFRSMTLYGYTQSFNLSGGSVPDRVLGLPVDANFFSLLGIHAVLGRTFLPGEDQPGRDHVVVLSHHLWQSRYGGDPGILGRQLELNGQAYTVIGVAPADFRLTAQADLWPAMDMSPAALGQRGNHSYSALGRLNPGVTVAAGRAEIVAIAARLAHLYPDSNGDESARVFALRDRLVRAPQRASLLTLLAAVGLILLIACANLANLMLARALARQKEMSIRLALGARRGRIVRQLLTESVLLALLGAALGSAMAWVGVRAVVGLRAFTLPQFNAIAVNGPVLVFTAVLALLSGVIFGLAPALQLSHPRANDQLSGAGAIAGVGRRRRWLSDGLIVAEIAVTLVLVVVAGLFVKSFVRLRTSDTGVNPKHLLTASYTLPDAAYPKADQQMRFNRTLLARVQAIPGVASASLSSELPIEGGSNGYVKIKGHTAEHTGQLTEWTEVSPSYFATLGIPIVEGIGFSAADADAWQAVIAKLDYDSDKQPSAALTNSMILPVVVNQAMARQYFPGEDPIGKEFSQGSDSGPWLRIQGVARDIAVQQLGPNDMAQAFFPLLAVAYPHLALRSALPQAALAEAVRHRLQAIDPTLPLYNLRTMDEVIAEASQGQAFQGGLLAAFALLALLLAAAGIYGVMAYVVGARTGEIGIRMALGATPASVMKLIVGGGMRLALIGVALGLAGALAAGRLIASQLFQVGAADTATLIAAPAVLLCASFLACALPARRAAAVDPNTALRHP